VILDCSDLVPLLRRFIPDCSIFQPPRSSVVSFLGLSLLYPQQPLSQTKRKTLKFTHFLPSLFSILRDRNLFGALFLLSSPFLPRVISLYHLCSHIRACTLRAYTTERSVMKEYRRDIETKSNRRRERRRSSLGASIFSHSLCSSSSLLMPPPCTIPTCTEMRVRASLSSLLPCLSTRSRRVNRWRKRP